MAKAVELGAPPLRPLRPPRQSPAGDHSPPPQPRSPALPSAFRPRARASVRATQGVVDEPAVSSRARLLHQESGERLWRSWPLPLPPATRVGGGCRVLWDVGAPVPLRRLPRGEGGRSPLAGSGGRALSAAPDSRVCSAPWGGGGGDGAARTGRGRARADYGSSSPLARCGPSPVAVRGCGRCSCERPRRAEPAGARRQRATARGWWAKTVGTGQGGGGDEGE